MTQAAIHIKNITVKKPTGAIQSAANLVIFMSLPLIVIIPLLCYHPHICNLYLVYMSITPYAYIVFIQRACSYTGRIFLDFFFSSFHLS